MFVHVRPNEPISSTQARSSNFKASNIRPCKTVSASNFCLDKLVRSKNNCPGRFSMEVLFIKLNQLVIVIIVTEIKQRISITASTSTLNLF